MKSETKTLIFNISHAGFKGYDIHTPIIGETYKNYIVVNHNGYQTKVNKVTLRENIGSNCYHQWQKGRGFEED